MKKLAILSAVAAVAFCTVQPGDAEAREGRRTAAVVGAIGGFAAGALIAGGLSNAYAAPNYGYAPAYGYGYAPAPVVRSYRPAYSYDYAPRPVYRTTRVVRTYQYVEQPYGYGRPVYSGYYGW